MSLLDFNNKIREINVQSYLQGLLGEKKGEFVSNLTSLVANDKGLQECDPITIMYSALTATSLNLSLNKNLGFAYVIPYKNNKEGKTEAQFQIGYKGLIQLAIRSGQFLNMNVTEIREGEMQEMDLLTGEIRFVAKPNRNVLPVAGYVAFFELTNGFRKMMFMTKESVEIHAKTYSQTYASKFDGVRKISKWTTDFDAMAKKTVLKQLLTKYAPLSVEMQKAVTFDQAVIRSENEPTYVDNEEMHNELPQKHTDGEINSLIKKAIAAKSENELDKFVSEHQEAMQNERLQYAVNGRLNELNEQNGNDEKQLEMPLQTAEE